MAAATFFRKITLTADTRGLEKGAQAGDTFKRSLGGVAAQADAMARSVQSANSSVVDMTQRATAAAGAQASMVAEMRAAQGEAQRFGTTMRDVSASEMRAAEALRTRWDEAYRNATRYAQVEASVAKAIGSRLVTVDQGNTILATAGARFKQMGDDAKSANDNIRLTTGQMQGLGYQVNDIGTMLAMGASPFQVMASQAGQVAQVLGDGPGGVRGSLAAMGSAIVGFAASLGPAVLGLAVFTAGVGAIAYAYRQDFPDMDETLDRHAAILDRVADRYDGLKAKIEEIGRVGSVGLNIEVGSVGRDLATLLDQQRKDLDRAFVGIESIWGGAEYGGANIASIPALPKFDAIRSEVEKYRADLRAGRDTTTEFRQELGELYMTAQAAGDLDAQKAIESAFALTEGIAKLLKLQAENRAALAEIANAPPPGTTGRVRGASTRIAEAFGDIGMDPIREGLKRQADELRKATPEVDRYTASVAEQKRSIEESVASLRLQVETFGQTEGAMAAARFEADALAQAQAAATAAGRSSVDPSIAAEIRRQAGEYGALTDQLRELNEAKAQGARLKAFDDEIAFRTSQVGRSEIEQQVAQQLRSVGLEYGSAAAAGREEQLRYLASVEQTKDALQETGDVGRDAFKGIFETLMQGGDVLDSITEDFAPVGRALVDAFFDTLEEQD